MDSEQRMLLTVKGLGSLKVADVATVAEVYSPGPHAMMDMKELPARRQTDPSALYGHPCYAASACLVLKAIL